MKNASKYRKILKHLLFIFKSMFNQWKVKPVLVPNICFSANTTFSKINIRITSFPFSVQVLFQCHILFKFTVSVLAPHFCSSRGVTGVLTALCRWKWWFLRSLLISVTNTLHFLCSLHNKSQPPVGLLEWGSSRKCRVNVSCKLIQRWNSCRRANGGWYQSDYNSNTGLHT